MAKKSAAFNLTLNEEQKLAKKEILEHAITVLKGQAGSGKTLLACQVALDLYQKKETNKIIVSRPLVTMDGEEVGFLPGTAFEKTLPYLIPIYANMYQLWDKIEIDALIHAGDIEICPIAFIKGRTFLNSTVIIDEAQNCTHSQLEGILGRLGRNSRMIICGDMTQCDLPQVSKSGFNFLDNLISVPQFKMIKLEANHRHDIVPEILQIYKASREISA
jgi:phosphate starvation-inducible PhoH-like protein